MAVAHGCVGDQHLGLRAHPVGDGLRPLLFQQIARAHRRIGLGGGRTRRPHLGRRARTARRLGVPVHGDVGDIGQDLGRPVLALLEGKEVRRRIDELGRVGVIKEGRVAQQVDDEIDVGRYAPDAELAQGPDHPVDRQIGRLRPGRNLDQQRVVIARDDCAGIGSAAIQTDAVASGRTIGGDPAVVGNEVVLRVFRRHPALQRMAHQAYALLARNARRFGQCLALGDQDLGLHDVNAGHLFGDGMFDLHAGVHLDEVELALVHIHQEFDCAGTFIVHMLADALAQLADLGALRVGQVGGGGALDNLLVAALHGAVAFIKVIDGAVLVAEDLHLDVAGAQDHLFQIALAIAEGGLGLAPTLQHLGLKLFGGVDRAHAATAAAPACLEHQGVADLGGFLADRVKIGAQHLGRGDDRNARLNRDPPGACLVAKSAHRLGLGADEGDARLFASLDKLGVFRQKPVAWMDRIGARQLGHADDFGDREIGANRREALTDQIGLVRLEAVQRKLVFLGIDGNRLLAHLVCRAHHADRDLATVGNQNLAEFGHRSPPMSAPHQSARGSL